MRLPHRLQGQKVKSQSHGAGAYCGGHLAAQLVRRAFITRAHSTMILNRWRRTETTNKYNTKDLTNGNLLEKQTLIKLTAYGN